MDIMDLYDSLIEYGDVINAEELIYILHVIEDNLGNPQMYDYIDETYEGASSNYYDEQKECIAEEINNFAEQLEMEPELIYSYLKRYYKKNNYDIYRILDYLR